MCSLDYNIILTFEPKQTKVSQTSVCNARLLMIVLSSFKKTIIKKVRGISDL